MVAVTGADNDHSRTTLDPGVPAVCIAVHGDANYFRAARQAALSVRQYTPFKVVLVHGPGPGHLLGKIPGAVLVPIDPGADLAHRAQRFLFKFYALAAFLRVTCGRHLLLLDADAVITRKITAEMLAGALQDRHLAMSEQTGIINSAMTRQDFIDHYRNHVLQWFENNRDAALDPEAFRFYNSGIVIGERAAFEAVAAWALAEVGGRAPEHRVGEHMITDQDYFQYWCNQLHPDSCTQLPWYWNHCEHWDVPFPRADALITHFSNFCLGPRRLLAMRMWLTRCGGGPGRRLAALRNPFRRS